MRIVKTFGGGGYRRNTSQNQNGAVVVYYGGKAVLGKTLVHLALCPRAASF